MSNSFHYPAQQAFTGPYFYQNNFQPPQNVNIAPQYQDAGHHFITEVVTHEAFHLVGSAFPAAAGYIGAFGAGISFGGTAAFLFMPEGYAH